MSEKWLRSSLTEEGYESCIGSGFCCKKTRCWLGTELHGPGPNCPSLIFDNGRYWCNEILKAEEPVKQNLKEGLYIGGGCCANLNTDRQKMLRKLLKSQSSQSNS